MWAASAKDNMVTKERWYAVNYTAFVESHLDQNRGPAPAMVIGPWSMIVP